MRIGKHPLLLFHRTPKVRFTLDGRELDGFSGEPIAAALLAAGVKAFSRSPKYHRPRGFFCAIGKCASCLMKVNGVPNVRICVTRLEEGMCIETQQGRGDFDQGD